MVTGHDIDLKDIIEKLAQKLLQTEEEKKEFLSKLNNYYSRKGRHNYSLITSIVFKEVDDESDEILELNLESIEELVEKESDIGRKINKLIDHIRLAREQKKYIDLQKDIALKRLLDISIKLAKSNQQLDNINRQYCDLDEKVRNLEEIRNKIYTEFVAILGIFATIIFAAFGGLEILKNILGNIREVGTGKLLVFSSLTVSAISILLFILLNGLARLMDKNVRSCGCHSNDSTCRHNIVQKHPAIVILNLVLFFVFVIGITEYFIPYRELFSNLYNGKVEWLKLLCIFLVYTIIAIALWLFYRIMKNKVIDDEKKKNKMNESLGQDTNSLFF